MKRLSAKHLYAGDVLFGVGNADPKSRTLASVRLEGSWVHVRFENGDTTMMQDNCYFRIESFQVPFESRPDIADDFRQSLRDSQRQFPVPKGLA